MQIWLVLVLCSFFFYMMNLHVQKLLSIFQHHCLHIYLLNVMGTTISVLLSYSWYGFYLVHNNNHPIVLGSGQIFAKANFALLLGLLSDHSGKNHNRDRIIGASFNMSMYSIRRHDYLTKYIGNAHHLVVHLHIPQKPR